MKKNELLEKFALYAFSYKGKCEYRNAAWRIVHEFGIESGVKIDDFSINDFEGTEISYKRRQQFNDRDCFFSSAMIVDFLLYVGAKYIESLKKKINTGREDESSEAVLKPIGFTITTESYGKIKELSERTGRTQASILEDALNCYFDSGK